MRGRTGGRLEVKVPSFFQCPISLEVMSSPVSLCTGVTYNRASIQRWLDTGHTTCPATMIPLPSTELIPNLTLRRLIHHWSSRRPAENLLRDLRYAPDPLPPLLTLADILSDPDHDATVKNHLAADSAPILASIALENSKTTTAVEAAIRVFAVIFAMDCIDESNKKLASAALGGGAASLVAVVSGGTTEESQIDAARVIGEMISFSDRESRMSIADTPGLARELIRLVGEGGRAAEAGMGCLVWVSETGRRAWLEMVRAGVVPAMVRILTAEGTGAATAERALRVMKAAVGCADGRAAACEAAEVCVAAVVGRMIRVGREGREAAVGVLWGLCNAARDPKARAAVAGASGGLAKVLVLMQGECSPAARTMSGELLRVFRVDSRSCLAGYDTKTTHIMPF